MLPDDSGVQVKPEGTVSVSDIVPPKLFSAVAVMVVVDDDPGETVEGDVATTWKSWMLNMAEDVCTKLPLVAVINRTYFPATLELQETVAVPEVKMLVCERDPQVSPADGDPSDRTIVPANPFVAARVMVDVADWPTFTAWGCEALIVKSGGGGPALTNFSRHPHPLGWLLHCSAP